MCVERVDLVRIMQGSAWSFFGVVCAPKFDLGVMCDSEQRRGDEDGMDVRRARHHGVLVLYQR
jgi:hypothetical protein